MAKRANQKEKLLLLWRLLWERTDESHPMRLQELIDALAGAGIRAERKSIYTDIQALRAAGVDVRSRKGRQAGWYLGKRPLDLGQLKLLTDAVQLCPLVPAGRAEELSDALSALASTHQAGQLRQRRVRVDRRAAELDKGLCSNVDKLHTAITNRKIVLFQYPEYREKANEAVSARCLVDPAELLWTQGHYTLAGVDQHTGQAGRYRVDRMEGLVVTALTGAGPDRTVYAPAPEEITLRCRAELAGAVRDHFGPEVSFRPGEEGWCTAAVSTAVDPAFLGWLFALGEGAYIAGPDWAARRMREQLAAAAARY